MCSGFFAAAMAATIALTACASAPKEERAFDPPLASAVNTMASEAAVAKPGTKVCRWVALGIAEKDLIRGIVQQREGNTVRVRIDDAGRFPNSLNGHRLARGEVITDVATTWTPCTF